MRIRKSKIFILFTFLFVMHFICFLPIHAYSYTLTYNKFMQMTNPGASKINSAALKVSSALRFARGILNLAATVTAPVALGLMLWDVYNRYRDNVKITVHHSYPFGLGEPVQANSSEDNRYYVWGYTSSWFSKTYCIEYHPVWNVPGDYCSGIAGFTHSDCGSSPLPSGVQVVGGYTNYIYLGNSHRGGCIPRYLNQVIRVEYYVYKSNIEGGSQGSYQPNSSPTPAQQSDIYNTEIAKEIIRQAIQRLETQAQAANERASQEITPSVANLPYPANFSLPRNSPNVSVLVSGLQVLENGVEVQKDVDYVIVDNQAVPVPEGQGPGESGQPETQPGSETDTDTDTEKPVPPISDGECVDCQRTKTFQQVWDNISSYASNVNLLSFLNRLVINPSVASSFTDRISFSLTGFGTVSFDLNTYHYRDIVAAIRFLVLGGAFVSAYYIIYR